MKKKNLWKKMLFLGAGVTIAARVMKNNQKKRIRKLLSMEEPVEATIPTLMLHGTYGTRRSLGGMIDRFQKKHLAYKALEIVVGKNNEIKISGQLDKGNISRNPLIQVVFKNNNAPDWQQADWLKNVLYLLREQFQIPKINLLGHSSGGVACLRFLLEYGNKPHVPEVEKLIVIGAPFNGEVVSSKGKTLFDLGKFGPLKQTDTYRYFDAYKMAIPRQINVLNIFSDLGNGSRSDGFVSVASAKSLRFLIKKQVESYHEKELFGLKAQHSLLHENKKVDQSVANFLWM